TAALPFIVITVPEFGAATSVDSQTRGYFLSGVPPGIHDVILTTDAGVAVNADIPVAPGAITAHVDFDLGNVQPISVRVSGQAMRTDGTAEGLHIELVELLDGGLQSQDDTDGEGHFDLDAIHGVYQIRARDGDHLPTAILPFLVVAGDEPIIIDTILIIPPEDGDLDGDGIDNADDEDIDGDHHVNDMDAFPWDPAENADSDGDGVGDRADMRAHGGTGVDGENPA